MKVRYRELLTYTSIPVVRLDSATCQKPSSFTMPGCETRRPVFGERSDAGQSGRANFLKLIGAHYAVAVFLSNEIAKIFGREEAFQFLTGQDDYDKTITIIYATKMRMSCRAVLWITGDTVGRD